MQGKRALKKGPIIAIDGHAGAGKSTVARALAARLGLPYLDTGSMYRAATVAVLRHARARMMDSLSELSDEEIGQIVGEADIAVSPDGQVSLEGDDITAEIRGDEATANVSRVSAISKVREALTPRQRRLASLGGVVEGRDIGTAVFPDADLKVFLTADLKERARRRAREHNDNDVRSLERRIAERDRQDSYRATSPLRIARDAEVIDTTAISAEEVVEKILQRCRQAGLVENAG